MENFNLKKFLTENKLTTNSRTIRENEEQVDELFGFGKSKGNPNNLKVGNEVTYTASNGNDGYNGKYVVGKILSSDRNGQTIGLYRDTSEPHSPMKPEQKKITIFASPDEVRLR